jgi:plasmid stabilization system protein ParE
MQLRWLKTAIIELEDIFLYINERNRPAAQQVVRRIRRASLRLKRFPFSGKQTDEARTYQLLIIRYPYAIYYAVDEDRDEVVILHVRHTARKKPAADDPHAG